MRCPTQNPIAMSPASATPRIHGRIDGAAPAVVAATERLVGALGEVLEPTAGDRLVMAGASHLVRGGSDIGSLTLVLEAIEEQVTLLRLFGEMDAEATTVATRIGREMADGLEQTSIVTGAYGAGGHEAGRVGVLGPTRMDYASNMAAVRAVARYLTRLLDDEER